MADRLTALRSKREQINNQIRSIETREKEKERKQRTRRLIQVGAIIETRLGIKTVEDAEAFCDKVMAMPELPAGRSPQAD